jgi:hypothetical protein
MHVLSGAEDILAQPRPRALEGRLTADFDGSARRLCQIRIGINLAVLIGRQRAESLAEKIWRHQCTQVLERGGSRNAAEPLREGRVPSALRGGWWRDQQHRVVKPGRRPGRTSQINSTEHHHQYAAGLAREGGPGPDPEGHIGQVRGVRSK